MFFHSIVLNCPSLLSTDVYIWNVIFNFYVFYSQVYFQASILYGASFAEGRRRERFWIVEKNGTFIVTILCRIERSRFQWHQKLGVRLAMWLVLKASTTSFNQSGQRYLYDFPALHQRLGRFAFDQTFRFKFPEVCSGWWNSIVRNFPKRVEPREVY